MAQVTVCDRCGHAAPPDQPITRITVVVNRSRAEQEYDQDALSERTWEVDQSCADSALGPLIADLGAPTHEWQRREPTAKDLATVV